MKIVYFDAQSNDADQLAKALPDSEIVTTANSFSTDRDLAVDAEVVSVFVDSKVTAEDIGMLPKLRLIAARSAGVDHIDLGACAARGITVCNVPHYGEATVAEHTFALILALSRKIFQSYERTGKMDFDREGLMGFDLHGKTLGVIGTGNIGRNVITIGRGFGMHVVAYDVQPDQHLAAELGFSYLPTLDEVLARSHVTTLHVPYLPETHHLLNEENLVHLRQGALVINTARGALIDTKALLTGLQTGRIGGVGLDVLEEEHDTYDRVEFLSQAAHQTDHLITMLHNHVLVSRDDVIITPHNAFNSVEAVQRIFDITVDNIKAWLKDAPSNVVLLSDSASK